MGDKEEIIVEWKGPFHIDDITADESKHTGIGLYQIYGHHKLYGKEVLLYIGRTQDSFKRRLKNRWVTSYSSDPENVKIYLGTIISSEKKLTEEEINTKIEKAEVLLINALKPAFNSSNIQSVKNNLLEDKYIVFNEANYRDLYPILDSEYFWKDYKNIRAIINMEDTIQIKREEDELYVGLNLSEKFNLPSTYQIWFTVDYDIWDDEGIPLVIQIYSEDKAVVDKLKGIEGFEYYQHSDGDASLFQEVSVNITLDELTERVNTIKEKVDEIKI